MNTLIQQPQNLVAHLRNADTNQAGFSYNPTNGDSNPATGFMVSIKGFEERVPVGHDLMAYGKHYFYRNAEMFADNGHLYLGCWFDGDDYVFDLSENVQTKESAIELGLSHEQLAIWDCASGSEYRLTNQSK